MQLLLLFAASFVVYVLLSAVPGLTWIARVPLLGFLGSVILVSALWNTFGKRIATARVQRRLFESYGRVDTPAMQGKLGAALLQAQRVAQAVGPLEHARAGEPTELEWPWRLANAYSALGRDEEALREVLVVLAADDEYAYGRAQLLAARLHARLGERDLAVRACEKFEANHGAEPEGLYELGAVLAARGDRAAARDTFARAARAATEASRFKRRADPWLATRARVRSWIGR